MPGYNNGNQWFKIFIGKLNDSTTVNDIQPLFERYGKVMECAVVKNFGFVHMENEATGLEAIRHLNNYSVNGSSIRVEAANNRKPSYVPTGTTKLFIGNISEGTNASDLRVLFEKYGTVTECDVVKNFAFVHIDTPDLTKVLKELNGYSLNGLPMKVQISTSRVRQKPGMGDAQQCYKCGSTGHWSKDCPKSTQMAAAMPGMGPQMQTMYGTEPSMAGPMTNRGAIATTYPAYSGTEYYAPQYTIQPEMYEQYYLDEYARREAAAREAAAAVASRAVPGMASVPGMPANPYELYKPPTAQSVTGPTYSEFVAQAAATMPNPYDTRGLSLYYQQYQQSTLF